jgi:hypothetical protein
MHPQISAESALRTSLATRSCPLNSGVAILDQLLAAVGRENDADALNAALDFRLLLAGPHEPEAVLRGFFQLRPFVEDHHFLACFRLRRWLESQIMALVYFDRCQPPAPIRLRLDCLSYPALCNVCARDASTSDVEAAWARVQFVTPTSVS